MINPSVYLHYLSALLDGDKQTCVSIVHKLVNDGTDLKDIYINLLQKAMYRVGHLWENSRATVTTEHIATKITENILSMLYPVVIDTPRKELYCTVTCVDKEFHELGAKMISDYIEWKGWHSTFLGANTPKTELVNYIVENKPELVGISANLYMNVMRAFKLIEEIKAKIPKQKIILGGQAFFDAELPDTECFKNVTIINSLDNLDLYLKEQF